MCHPLLHSADSLCQPLLHNANILCHPTPLGTPLQAHPVSLLQRNHLAKEAGDATRASGEEETDPYHDRRAIPGRSGTSLGNASVDVSAD